jgi:hypothetical protein
VTSSIKKDPAQGKRVPSLSGLKIKKRVTPAGISQPIEMSLHLEAFSLLVLFIA